MLAAMTERMKVRDMAAVRREHLGNLAAKNKKIAVQDMTVSGLPTDNYGKPFAYIKSCLPGHKLDSSSSRGNNGNAGGPAHHTR